jgi:hypothetical protein
MRLNIFLLVVMVIVVPARFAFAGSPFLCPIAVNSVHGNALALVNDTIQWNGQTGKLIRHQFTVMSKNVNDYQKISAPVTYWGAWRWEVVLDVNKESEHPFSMSCLVPLVTDDARFLILLRTGDAFGAVLRIYRKGDSSIRMEDGSIKGVLVREIKLDELWPEGKIESFWSDHTPEWFAGGSFDFPEDNLHLVHKTRWGTTVRIDLQDGRVLKE